MRLKSSRSAGDDALLLLVVRGLQILRVCELDFEAHVLRAGGPEATEVELANLQRMEWAEAVIAALEGVFPTRREAFVFLRTVTAARPGVPDQPYADFRGLMKQLEQSVAKLDELRLTDLRSYTDLPAAARLYVEDIDSFSKVRDVNPAMVSDVLTKGGRLEVTEDEVQLALEQILDVPVHRRDWGGEINDLYTANVRVNGARTAAGFALKGYRSRELRIRDCGKNGDQLVRLLESPAELFVVQYVGPISDAVIKDIAGKVEQRRGQGQPAWYCIIDGQDTARILRAHGKLPLRPARAEAERNPRPRSPTRK